MVTLKVHLIQLVTIHEFTAARVYRNVFWGGQAAKLRDNLLLFYVFLLLGVKQQSCETTIVIVSFPIIIIFLPWESMAAHRTPW